MGKKSKAWDNAYNYLKGLYLPSDPVETPKIIYADPNDALEEYISYDSKLDIIPLHNHYHMYVDLLYYVDPDSINIIATKK